MSFASSYQSPIAPGRSWYEDSCGSRPRYACLNSDTTCDVVIVGGGFCGLSAALYLAKAGVKVVLLEAHRLGDGASGRNGGQMGTGQRADVLELEKEFGLTRAKALWDMAESAKHSLLETAQKYAFDIDYQQGQLSCMHKARYEKEARQVVERLNSHYNYDAIHFLDKAAMDQAIGSKHYFGGTRDAGTGHIHPLKYVIGLAKAAAQTGALIYEESPVLDIQKSAKIQVKTARGTVTAERCLLALNGYHNDLRPELAKRVLPIQSFIGASVPLPKDTSVLPNFEAVDDSRFVVRYFRKTKDNRLLFGGREAYGKATPKDIERAIRKQVKEIYPHLADIELTHTWGGNVAITIPRQPYVRELQGGIWTAGGFAGHGVMLSNYTGRMIAEHFLGENDQIKQLVDLNIPAFPGGATLRNPLKTLALTWYAMLDKF